MAILPESLIQPHGPIDPSFFPDDVPPPDEGEGTLLGRLATYIERAFDKAAEYDVGDRDAAVRNWALHLAFDDAYTLMSARPATETYLGGLGGAGFNSKQLETFAVKAAEYRQLFEEMVSGSSSAADVPRGLYTRTVRNVFDW